MTRHSTAQRSTKARSVKSLARMPQPMSCCHVGVPNLSYIQDNNCRLVTLQPLLGDQSNLEWSPSKG